MTLIEEVHRATADALALSSRIGSARDLPEPDVLRRRIATVLDEVDRKVVAAGASKQEAEDIRYALVAFLDEQIFRSPWPGRQEWMLEPLQITYFNENTAGEGFFRRLEAAEHDPRLAHVLLVYHACLALGFQGKYAVRNDGLGALIESVGAKLRQAMPAGDVVSPHGTPPDAGGGRAGRELPIVAFAISVVVLSALIYGGLKARVASAAGATNTDLGAMAATLAKAKAK